MSAKVKLSYTNPAELEQIGKALAPYTDKIKIAKEQKSGYKRAYFDIKIPATNNAKPLKGGQK